MLASDFCGQNLAQSEAQHYKHFPRGRMLVISGQTEMSWLRGNKNIGKSVRISDNSRQRVWVGQSARRQAHRGVISYSPQLTRELPVKIGIPLPIVPQKWTHGKERLKIFFWKVFRGESPQSGSTLDNTRLICANVNKLIVVLKLFSCIPHDGFSGQRQSTAFSSIPERGQ